MSVDTDHKNVGSDASLTHFAPGQTQTLWCFLSLRNIVTVPTVLTDVTVVSAFTGIVSVCPLLLRHDMLCFRPRNFQTEPLELLLEMETFPTIT